MHVWADEESDLAAERWVQGGCIIRAVFLDDIYQAYKRNPDLHNLLVDPEFAKKLVSSEQAWRSVVTKVGCKRLCGLMSGHPAGCIIMHFQLSVW